MVRLQWPVVAVHGGTISNSEVRAVAFDGVRLHCVAPSGSPVPRDSLEARDGVIGGKRVNINARIKLSDTAPHSRPVQTECRGEDYGCKRGYPVHPPVVMIFDEELGRYREACQCCVAIWTVNSRGHVPGTICGQAATQQVADVQVCEHHYRRVREWMNVRDQLDVREARHTGAAIRAQELDLDETRA